VTRLTRPTPTTPTRRQVERAVLRIYLTTRGRGRRWRAVHRAVNRFVSSAQARRVLRLAFALAVARRVFRDAREDFVLIEFVRWFS
jgi:hypothetical protein